MNQQIEELSPSISAVDDSISAVNNALKPLFDSNVADLSAKVELCQIL